MNTKHTPGPWAVECPYGEPGVYITAANPRLTNPLICRLIDQARTPEGAANARLIAAAPELLEALRDVVWMVKDKDPRAYANARAVLAKVEGGGE